jgi:hypothetical protein
MPTYLLGSTQFGNDTKLPIGFYLLFSSFAEKNE